LFKFSLVLRSRGSLVLPHVSDHFIDCIDYRFRFAKHYMMRCTRYRAIDPARRKVGRLLMHRDYNLGSRVKVGIGMARVR
jgi:hypothetical protein